MGGCDRRRVGMQRMEDVLLCRLLFCWCCVALYVWQSRTGWDSIRFQLLQGFVAVRYISMLTSPSMRQGVMVWTLAESLSSLGESARLSAPPPALAAMVDGQESLDGGIDDWRQYHLETNGAKVRWWKTMRSWLGGTPFAQQDKPAVLWFLRRFNKEANLYEALGDAIFLHAIKEAKVALWRGTVALDESKEILERNGRRHRRRQSGGSSNNNSDASSRPEDYYTVVGDISVIRRLLVGSASSSSASDEDQLTFTNCNEAFERLGEALSSHLSRRGDLRQVAPFFGPSRIKRAKLMDERLFAARLLLREAARVLSMGVLATPITAGHSYLATELVALKEEVEEDADGDGTLHDFATWQVARSHAAPHLWHQIRAVERNASNKTSEANELKAVATILTQDIISFFERTVKNNNTSSSHWDNKFGYAVSTFREIGECLALRFFVRRNTVEALGLFSSTSGRRIVQPLANSAVRFTKSFLSARRRMLADQAELEVKRFASALSSKGSSRLHEVIKLIGHLTEARISKDAVASSYALWLVRKLDSSLPSGMPSLTELYVAEAAALSKTARRLTAEERFELRRLSNGLEAECLGALEDTHH